MTTTVHSEAYKAEAIANLAGAPCFFCGKPATRVHLDPAAEGCDTPLCANIGCYVQEMQTTPEPVTLPANLEEWVQAGVIRVTFGGRR